MFWIYLWNPSSTVCNWEPLFTLLIFCLDDLSIYISGVFFNLHAFGGFPDFFLWLISSFIAFWSESMHGMISILVYLWRAVLWTSRWSILEKVPWALKKKVYSVALGCRVLNISDKSVWSSVSFRALVSLLILCLDDLSNVVSGVLKSLQWPHSYQ